MKIRILAEGHRIKLWLPLRVIRWNVFWKLIEKSGKQITQYKDISIKIYKELKKWKKENGSFDIVNVESKDAIVRITI